MGAVQSPFKVSVISDEISQDFDHACSVIANDFGLKWVEIREMWGKNLQASSDAEIAEAQKILAKYGLQVTDIASPLFKVDWPGAPKSQYGSKDDMHGAAEVAYKHQDEVVERMVAEPGSKAFSRLSVMLQYRYWMDKLFDVPPESFEPPPKVNSAIVRMIPRTADELAPVDVRILGELVTAAFSQRRKMLRNTLGAYRDRVDFDALGFDLQRRAEDVPVDEYVRVAQRLEQ